MSASETTSSVTSRSDEEDVNEPNDTASETPKSDEEMNTQEQKCKVEDSKSPDKSEKVLSENRDEHGSKNSEDELVIEYNVEINAMEKRSQEEISGHYHKAELGDDKEITPILEVTKKKEKEHDTKKPLKEEPSILTPREIEAPLQTTSDGEVVEEVRRSVKEQIAIFANLNIQETHGTPKSGVASAFAVKQNKNQSENVDQTPLCEPSERGVTVSKNVSRQSFDSVETGVLKEVEKQPVGSRQPPQQPDGTTFERPRPSDRPKNPPPQSKKFVINKGFTSSPMTFGTPFGNESKQLKVTEVDSSQYLGPDVMAQTSKPPMMISLRRPGPEAPWGFAVFGGTDYGCPPFISRVTLHSIAAGAGLEVGDVVISICDTLVQDKDHSEIKAEILRAGNELDFVVIKQGIDKAVLAQKAPHLLRTPAPSPLPSLNYNRSQKATGTWSGAKTSSPSYADKVIRTRSFRLLDEHINAMSLQSVLTPNMSPSRSADLFSPTRNCYNEFLPQPYFNMERSYQNANMSNYNGSNRANSAIYSPGMSYTIHTQQSRPITEMNTNRTYLATPASINQTRLTVCPNRVYNNMSSRSVRPTNWSSAASNQQINNYESRISVEHSSADDPGLMTQYYGTQQTCYARYHPQRQRQEEMIHQQSTFQSSMTSGWNNTASQHPAPTNRVVYRSPTQEPGHLPQRQYLTLHPSSNYQDQERWLTTGSLQTHNTGWL